MYYLRTRPKADAIQFTVDMTALALTKTQDAAADASDALKLKEGEGQATPGTPPIG